MGLQPDGSSYYTSGTNFDPTAKCPTTLAFFALIDFQLDRADIQTVFCNQNGGSANQDALARINGLAQGANANKLDITRYSLAPLIHHYIPTNPLAQSGLQGIYGVLTAADLSSIFAGYNKIRESVASDQGPDAGGWRAAANPLKLFARGAGDKCFDQKCYRLTIWRVDPGLTAFENMAGKFGIYRHPFRYSYSDIIYNFPCEAAPASFVEQFSGETFTKTGTINVVSTPAGVETVTVVACNLIDDCSLNSAAPDTNTGTSASFVIGRNGAGTAARRWAMRWTSYAAMGIPAGSTIISDIITWNVTAFANAAGANMTLNRMTTDTWVEGDNTIGATWDDTNFDNVTPSAHPWATGAFQGAPAGKGGDCTATDAITTPMPTSTGSKTVDITTLSQKILDGGFANDILWAANSDTSVITLATMTVDTAEGGTPPTRSITYIPPVVSTGRARIRQRGAYAD